MQANEVWVLTLHSHDYYDGWKDCFIGLFASKHAINNKLTGYQINKSEQEPEWRKRNAHYNDDYYSAKLSLIQS